jgi:1-deoxy-D-xylulose-5-phosphate synthase
MRNKIYPILDRVEMPSDIRDLDLKDLETLASDIREYILDTISKTGGHLAAGLGTG